MFKLNHTIIGPSPCHPFISFHFTYIIAPNIVLHLNISS